MSDLSRVQGVMLQKTMLQNALNQAVWLLEEGDVLQALRVLMPLYDEGPGEEEVFTKEPEVPGTVCLGHIEVQEQKINCDWRCDKEFEDSKSALEWMQKIHGWHITAPHRVVRVEKIAYMKACEQKVWYFKPRKVDS